MKLVVYTSGDKDRETVLVDAMRTSGAHVTTLVDPDPEADADLHCVIGLKCLRHVRALTGAGLPYLYLDKGYNRDWPRWWRFAYCRQQPTDYLLSLSSVPDRATAQGWLNNLKPWRVRGKHILYAGSSAKYSLYMDLPDPAVMASEVVTGVQAVTTRRIVYRPKPSYRDAVPVMGAEYSRRSQGGPDIHRDLVNAHALVTHGSSCCFDALLAGVPSIVLGDGVAAPISSRTLDEIERPLLASEEERRQLLANLAYCQWSLQEFKRGDPWEIIHFLMKKSI